LSERKARFAKTPLGLTVVVFRIGLKS